MSFVSVKKCDTQSEPADYTFRVGLGGLVCFPNKDKDRIFVTTDAQFKIAQAGMLTNHEVLHLFQNNYLNRISG